MITMNGCFYIAKSIFSYFPDIARTSKMFYTLYIIEKSGKKQ